MKIDEALYQLKQNIKMNEIEGTTSNQNEREKVLLDYITNLQTIEQQYGAILSENAELENKITNLQEQLHQASLDIQELTEKDIGCPSWCDKLTNLQEENRLLKMSMLEKQFPDLNAVEVKIDTYKQRNEKAIEYIGNGNIGIPRKTRDKFIAILKGEDKE